MGEVFAGRYELLDPIATGGMGTVWCVRDRADDQLKAAKILRQSDAATLLRFVREQSMRIDHTHVVTPLSWAGMDDRVLFTMPLVRGGSVSDLLRRYGALPLRWVGLLLDQTLQALEAVHAAGIVHRDVKPANLLLEPTGAGMPHLRLTDFGIAVPLDEPRMTRTSMIIGSPGYMAPEQWRGADPDPRADLWSVGQVGITMLTGSRPAAGDEPVDVDRHRTGHPLDDALLDLLGAATAPDPADRPTSAAAMRADLAALQLVSLPPEPGEDVVVPDLFAGSTFLAGGELPGTVAAAPVAPLASGAPTRVQPVAAPRASALPGVLLVLVGLLAIAAALVVGLG
jgi:eukaryotic-like serine/threonine-protein kinase